MEGLRIYLQNAKMNGIGSLGGINFISFVAGETQLVNLDSDWDQFHIGRGSYALSLFRRMLYLKQPTTWSLTMPTACMKA
jgi:hypothetical protein